MDRRQRKSREAIFGAFIALLSQKDFAQITVGEIIDRADVGRATFYAHFETKDYLLKELCEELFCHIFDSTLEEHPPHHHIFDCASTDSVFLHLFQHLQRNDNQILQLLSCQNNDLFFQYFRANLQRLVATQLPAFAARKPEILPQSYWISHITATFVDTLRWWMENGMKESAEVLNEYFLLAV